MRHQKLTKKHCRNKKLNCVDEIKQIRHHYHLLFKNMLSTKNLIIKMLMIRVLNMVPTLYTTGIILLCITYSFVGSCIDFEMGRIKILCISYPGTGTYKSFCTTQVIVIMEV